MLDTIYTILIAAGIVLPLLSLLFGGVDALLGGVDLDLDGDGRLSREELHKAYQKLRERSKLHLANLRARAPSANCA